MTLSQLRVVVTGANSGVGYWTARHCVREGAQVVTVCRSAERGEAAVRRLEQEGPGSAVLALCDMSDMEAVRTLAGRIAAEGPVHILVNNAGVHQARRSITPDGFERTIATNHLGHFLLTASLRPALKPAPSGAGIAPRVINVSSKGHFRGDLRRAGLRDIFCGRVNYAGLQAYCDSKLANVLFTRELARRFGEDGLVSHAVHPGVLSTRIWNQSLSVGTLMARMFKPFMKRPASGGEAVAESITHPGNGLYFDETRVQTPSEQARDPELAARCWDVSEELTGASF